MDSTMFVRRKFICTAAAAGAAAVMGSAVAYAAETPADSSFDAAPANADAAPAGMPAGAAEPGAMETTALDYEPAVGEYPLGVPTGTPTGLSWLDIPEPITNVTEEYAADVVVIGAGIAGLNAARAAMEEGASVIVVEALDACQGRGLDVGTFNSTNQKEVGFETSEEELDEMCLEMTRYAGNRVNQTIMRTWAKRCGDDFDWWFKDVLEPKGYTVSLARWPLEVDYEPVSGEWFPQYIAANEIEAPDGGGYGGVESAVLELGEYDKDNGVEFHFNMRARQLVRGTDNKSGRVSAVIAEDVDGNYVKFTANNGIVLATGDYAHNTDMMQAWCPSQADLAGRSALTRSSSMGDGHLMGMWVGGMMQGLPHPYMAHASAGDLGTFPSLYVDINGRRFTNEDIPGQTFADTVDELPCKVWWQIEDAEYPNQLKWSQPGHGSVMTFTGDIDAWNDAIATGDRDTIEQMISDQGVTTAYAWTIAELADAISVDPDVLQATIERYNELCEAGHDDDFGKQAKRLFPVSTPPYFYSTNTWNFLVMVGGLKSNEKAEVLDRFGNPIPGLYACGNVQGSRFAYNYPTIVPGISHSMCLTYGRVAGQQAATNDTTITEYRSLFRDAQLTKAAATAEAAAAATYNDGTYTASYEGIGGNVPVTVTISGGKVTSVEVGENSETDGIGSKAIEQLPDEIVTANGTGGVSAVSGATVTSQAIFNGVNDCLQQASK